MQRAVISVGDKKVTLDVANTPQLRTQGLMRRLSLEENAGMIFVFDECSPRSFWMKETYIPLSIAYLDDGGRVINIEKMTPLNLESVRSQLPVRYALEMNEGWFEKNGIQAGDIIQLPEGLRRNDIENMNETILRRIIRGILRENFISHSDEPHVGDRVINNNPGCKHYQSEGEVIEIKDLDSDMGKVIVYKVSNNGNSFSTGDVLEKTMDQLTRAQ